MMYASRRFPGLCLAVCLLAGCGAAGPPTCDVTGTVTWNGAPLAEGDILFEPADGKGVPGAGKITAGRFRLRTTPGKKKIQVHATRDTGKIDPVMQSPVREALIPERFNARTTLTRDVTAGGDNHFVFDLSGPP
jgi:hypothetical protein